jgi:hypothetical protein
VDLPSGVIHVVRSYDPKEHSYIETKNRQLRRVPIASVLRDYLIAHKAALAALRRALLPRFAGEYLHTIEREKAGSHRLEASRPVAYRSARVSSHLRQSHDRGGRERESAFLLHGPLFNHGHAGQVWPPDAGERGAGGCFARYVPRREGAAQLWPSEAQSQARFCGFQRVRLWTTACVKSPLVGDFSLEEADTPGRSRTCARGLGNRCSIH